MSAIDALDILEQWLSDKYGQTSHIVRIYISNQIRMSTSKHVTRLFTQENKVRIITFPILYHVGEAPITMSIFLVNEVFNIADPNLFTKISEVLDEFHRQ